MLLEQHSQRQTIAQIDRPLKMEDGRMLNSVASQHLPARGHFAINRGAGHVLLWIGLAIFRRNSPWTSARAVVDSVFFIEVRAFRGRECDALAMLQSLKFAKEEAANRSFIVRQSGAIIRK